MTAGDAFAPGPRHAAANQEPAWGSAHVRAVCEVLAGPGHPAPGWATIESVLWDLGIELEDDEPTDACETLQRTLMTAQAGTARGAVVVEFIQAAMNPALYADRSRFEALREGVNRALRFKALSVDSTGRLHRPDSPGTAGSTAERLRTELARRGGHPETLRYCDEALIDRSLFYALFQACRGLSARIQGLTGLRTDGLMLVNDAFNTRAAAPRLRLNALMTETDIGDHRGLEGMIRGIFNTFRVNSADVPRVTRNVSEQDALDIFGTLSYIHRRLDAVRAS